MLPEGYERVEAVVRAVLRDVLALDAERAVAMEPTTPLFGTLPELDSLAVAGVLTEIEDRLGIVIDDEDVDAEMMETFGSLTRFVAARTLV